MTCTIEVKPTQFIFNSANAARLFAISHCGEVRRDTENEAILLCITKKSIEAAKKFATKLPKGQ